jgi:NADH dehydrogenase (ubiquinone) 1 alpha subcomplex subunit 8
MRENCLKEFDAHWDCLEWNNQKYNLCRKPERTLNKCMFEKLVSATSYFVCTSFPVDALFQGLTKTIPGTPQGQTPIHEVQNPIFTRQQH